jgi:hypothetical protein
MFSIIRVFNDEETLRLNLFKSLDFQKKPFGLILVDNKVPRPLTKALNEAVPQSERGVFNVCSPKMSNLLAGFVRKS